MATVQHSTNLLIPLCTLVLHQHLIPGQIVTLQQHSYTSKMKLQCTIIAFILGLQQLKNIITCIFTSWNCVLQNSMWGDTGLTQPNTSGGKGIQKVHT